MKLSDRVDNDSVQPLRQTPISQIPSLPDNTTRTNTEDSSPDNAQPQPTLDAETSPLGTHTDTEGNIAKQISIGENDRPAPLLHHQQHPPSPDPNRPIMDRCHGFGKIDAEINQCDNCELQFHTECMLSSPGGSQYYCQDCASSKQPPSEQPHTQDTSSSDSSGLSESSTSKSESEDDYVPSYPTRSKSGGQPNLANSSSTTQKTNLRPRGKQKS